MKNRHHILIAIIAIITTSFCSCEKFSFDQESTSNYEGDGNVVISIQSVQDKSFQQQTGRSSQEEISLLSDVCTRISFAIFDGEEKITTINQTTDTPDFGHAYLNLDEGEYRLVVIAHNGKGNCSITSPEKVKFANNKLTDTFYYYGKLNVQDDGAQALIDLKRAVAKMHFNLNGERMPTAHSIKFYYTGGSSTLNAVTGHGCVNSRQTETFDIAEDTSGYDVYTFPQESNKEIKTTISILNSDAEAIKTLSKDKIPVSINKITICNIEMKPGSGDGEAEGGFNIKVNPKWDGEILVDFE